MTSSEDVLLAVGHVKYKKDEGTLYVMSERVAWIQGNRDTVSLSHRFADIKSQKISPEGKPKIQLQLVLHDNVNLTFHFVHPDGPAAQSESRNQVKEWLLQMLPRFKRQANAELEEKNKILSENPALLRLYKDLVTDHIVSADEFWKVHAQSFMKTQQPSEKQEVGVSSGFLTEIQPTTDGVNGIVYNLTTSHMDSIYKTYPAVRKKHNECVPVLMTESEFWAKFFQSHYFHRDRLPVSKDVFYSCARSDDKEMRKGVESLRIENSDIIEMIEDPNRVEDVTVDATLTAAEKDKESGVTAHRNMIKRFNQHSIMVLKACERSTAVVPEAEPPKKKNKKEREEAAALQQETEFGNKDDPAVVAAKNARLREKIAFEDLKAPPPPQFHKLQLSQVDRYLNGPVPVYKTERITAEQLKRSATALKDLSARWGHKKTQLLDSKLALNLIGELSPGGAMMKSSASDDTSLSVPPEVETELRNTYISLSELLRHFWSCFPPTTSALEEKLKSSHETLKKFEQIKLQQLKDRLSRDLLPLSILNHITSMLSAADMKYNQYSSNQAKANRIRR